jgi:CheY-like chemotaxis protein
MDVLIVDDKPLFCDLIRQLLHHIGLTTIGVADGQAALTYLHQTDRLPRRTGAAEMPCISDFC